MSTKFTQTFCRMWYLTYRISGYFDIGIFWRNLPKWCVLYIGVFKISVFMMTSQIQFSEVKNKEFQVGTVQYGLFK